MYDGERLFSYHLLYVKLLISHFNIADERAVLVASIIIYIILAIVNNLSSGFQVLPGEGAVGRNRLLFVTPAYGSEYC